MGGGYFLGWCIAMAAFRDKQLYRLAMQHYLDVAYQVGFDTQSSGLSDTVPTKPNPDVNLLKNPNEMVSISEL